MNSVEELKQYAEVHARGLEIPDYARLVGRIHSDGRGPGSWAGEWCLEGDRLAGRGRPLEAGRRYLMARFPFVDGPARQEAYEKSLAMFENWREGQDVHRLDVEYRGRRVGCWTSGLSATRRKPLLIVMGGHLTLKEQWAPALPVFARLGMAAVATELPQVGENTVPYDGDSPGFLSAVLDAVADRADVARAYALAMSFSGHLALRCAMDDSRIRGVATVGAPLGEFFTDTVWRKELPQVTVDTLAHLTGAGMDELADWALPADRLAALDIPVAYVASLRDEVIPPGDLTVLRRQVRNLHLLVHDDVHGSPAHGDENKLWLALSLLRMQGVRDGRTLYLGLMYQAARIRSLLSARRRSRSLGLAGRAGATGAGV
ncbi:alpha/beta hydrolase [Streptomyces sp. NPDC048275]|uniref:alpha/beta fold hydrolase n=1 Tax=Streptomyces sp. NPDC048275 TaxID=3155629 RepID=UPI0033C19ACB